MKVIIALASLPPGMEELQPLAEGHTVPLAKVRLRQAVLKRRAESLQDNLSFHARQSDMDMVKDLKIEIDRLKQQVAALSRIRSTSDIAKYNEYIENYLEVK